MNDWQKLKRHKLETPPSLAETTSHLQLPEVIGGKVDKRTLRKTGRTKQFATRVSKEWLGKIKGIAERENLKLVEVLEKSLECYEKQEWPKILRIRGKRKGAVRGLLRENKRTNDTFTASQV